jgi:hypothetical protein
MVDAARLTGQDPIIGPLREPGGNRGRAREFPFPLARSRRHGLDQPSRARKRRQQ